MAYTVTSTGDGDNTGPNTACDDGTGHCTLRAAIQAANSHAGDDGISFNIPTNDNYDPNTGTWFIQVPRQLPDISSNIAITGPGASKLYIQRDTGTQFRIFNVTSTGAVSISDLTVANGMPANNGSGGGIQNANTGLLTLTNIIFFGNSASFGGGFYNASTGGVTISGCTFRGNLAFNDGGAVANQAQTVIGLLNSVLEQNVALHNGGGIYVNAGTVNLIRCTLVGNNSNSTSADTGGGAIYNAGTMAIDSCDFSLNQVKSGTGHKSGGAIYNAATGTANIYVTTFENNSVQGGDFAFGGALYNLGTMDVVNSTLAGNFATSRIYPDGSAQGGGGAIDNDAGPLRISNATIVNNRFAPAATSPGGTTGGVLCNGGSCAVKSTIIAQNTAISTPDDVGAVVPFTSAGFNLIGVSFNGSGFTANDQTGTASNPLDPKLDPAGLKNNGGPTPTIALVYGSPAIDKGSVTSLTGPALGTDQRGNGFARKFDDPGVANGGGDGTDVGAFEAQSALPPPPTPTPTATPTAAPRLVEISTRMAVQTGDNVLFGGFIVSGNQPKKVIIRAIGPSLTNFGVQGALSDPTLELYSGSTFLESNDNWVDSPNKQAIIDSNVAPGDNRESAIVKSLPAGGTSYTAILRGANNTGGIGVVEVYDLDPSADSTLANISSRGFVQTGDNVMFAGVYVAGTSPLKVIIRALGPSLTGFGVQGALADPALELHDSNGTVIEANDNWVDSSNKQAIMDTGIPPSNNAESAIVRTLAPGPPFTAIVRGVSNGTGIAVVEIYALP